MDQTGVDGLLVTQPLNIRYFAGGPLTQLFDDRFNFFILILPKDVAKVPALLMSTGREGASSTSWIEDRRFWTYGETGSVMEQGTAYDLIWETIRDKGLAEGTIGVPLGPGTRLGLSLQEFETLQGGLPRARFEDSSPVVFGCRKIKSELEIEKLRRTCEITCQGFEAGFRSLRAGMTERELEAVVRGTYFQEGATMSGFLATLCGGERMMWPDALASDYVIADGDLVMLDGGAEFDGYHGDMSRMAVVGTPTDEMRCLYDAAVQANDAVLDTVRAGVPIREICRAGVQSFRESGFGHLMVFGGGQTGHGLGLSLHEPPDLRLDSHETLEAGMVLAIEPAITDIEGWNDANAFYILEQNIVVREDGYELLTPMTKELWVAGNA
jgi:Xaa-Pro aminopeptidase